MTEREPPTGGSPEDRVDLTGLSRLSERPPPPRGEGTVRVVRALSILFLAIAAAGLPWYFVTRNSNDPQEPRGGATSNPSPTSSPTGSPTARSSPGTYEVFNVQNCANLRAEPSTSSTRLDCLIPGIRLESDGQTQQVEGRLWRQVRYERKKLDGWMADEYLKPV